MQCCKKYPPEIKLPVVLPFLSCLSGNECVLYAPLIAAMTEVTPLIVRIHHLLGHGTFFFGWLSGLMSYCCIQTLQCDFETQFLINTGVCNTSLRLYVLTHNLSCCCWGSSCREWPKPVLLKQPEESNLNLPVWDPRVCTPCGVCNNPAFLRSYDSRAAWGLLQSLRGRETSFCSL